MSAKRPATCSLYACKGTAEVPLKATDGVWWFCAAHAPEYQALGYLPLDEGEAAAQMTLA